MKRHDAYFQIAAAARRVEDQAFGDLPLPARRILEYVGIALSERNVRVTDVVRGNGMGTAPTVYSHLGELEREGWIVMHTDPEDKRAKLIRLTPRAHAVYGRMADEIIGWVRGRND